MMEVTQNDNAPIASIMWTPQGPAQLVKTSSVLDGLKLTGRNCWIMYAPTMLDHTL